MIILLLFAQVDSLSMDQAIDQLLAKSPAYYEAKVSLEKSRILFYQTLSSLLPTMSATASYTRTKVSDIETSMYSGMLSLNQPLFDLEILSSVFVSGRQIKGSTILYKSEIAGLLLKLKIAYYSLINARELLNSSKVTIERAEKNLELVKTKYELGAASKLEMLQGEVFYLSALQDRAKAKTLEITAQEELKLVIGMDNDIYLTDTLVPPDSTEFPSLDSLFTILESVNYNIQIAQEMRNAAKLNLVSSYLKFLPKVSFFYGYTYSSDSLVFDFQHVRDNAARNYGISMSFPVFEIKSLIFNYLNAKKEFQLKELEKERILLETEKSLKTTYFTLYESYDRLQFAHKAFDAANEASVIAREQYALGLVSFLEFLTSEKDLYEAKMSYKSSLSEFYIQRASLSYLLGELSFDKER